MDRTAQLVDLGCNAKAFTRKWPDGKGGELTAIVIMTKTPLPTILDEAVSGLFVADTINGLAVEFKQQVPTRQFIGNTFSGIMTNL